MSPWWSLVGFFLLASAGTFSQAFYYGNQQQQQPVDLQIQQQQQWNRFQQQYPYSGFQQQQRPMIVSASEQQVSVDSICQGGFVEHCLVQANQDGEQRLLELNSNSNKTMMDEHETLSREFDGMCYVIVRFIECINNHHMRCNTDRRHQHQHGSQDVFYQSWTRLCASDSNVRNKYLQHARCIKHALSTNNGQEECQARFQGYFLAAPLDSIENTVQYGCCAFNEWQYCIDSLINKQCGPDATRSIEDLIEQASGGLISSLCDKKLFGRKSKACLGKKNYNFNKLQTLDPRMNVTLQKYIGIFGDFIDRLPDDDEDGEDDGQQQQVAAGNQQQQQQRN